MPRIGTGLVTAALLLAAPALQSSVQAATTTPSAATLTYYLPPTGYMVSNFGVTADGAGDIWFGASGPTRQVGQNQQPTPSLVRLHPASAVAGSSAGMTSYATPDPTPLSCCANQMRSVTYNRDDDKLYYVRSDGGYGAVTPSAAGTSTGIAAQSLPGSQDLWDVAPAKGGGAWLTEKSTSNVGPTFYGARIARVQGDSLSEGPNIAVQNGAAAINDSRYDAQPSGIAVDAAGKPWFVEENPGLPGYRIGSYGSGDSYAEYQVSPCEAANPCSGSYTGQGLTDIAIASDRGIWFVNNLNRKIGRLDPVTGTMTQFLLSSVDSSLANSRPLQIVAAPDGSLWVTVIGTTNALVRIVPGIGAASPSATFRTLGANRPLGITTTATDVWFGATNPGAGTTQLGRLSGVVGDTPSGGGSTPVDPTTGTGTGTGTGTPATASPTAAMSAPVTLVASGVGQTRLDPPQSRNGEINTNQVCVGPPQATCSVVYLVREHEYVTGFSRLAAPTSARKPASAKAKGKPKPRTLAKKTVVSPGGQQTAVTLKLNGLGRRILKAKGRLKVDVIATEQLAGGATRVLSTRTLTVKSPQPRTKHGG